MPAFQQQGTVYVIHSNRYYTCNHNKPFCPNLYWNVITTTNNIIPVVTNGYKNTNTAKQKIIQNVRNVQECILIHEQTEEEHDKEFSMLLNNVRYEFST